jgi:hypothetical protein
MRRTRLGTAGAALVLDLAGAVGGRAAPVPPSPPAVVHFTVEGGIAGRQERLDVADDGSLRLFVRDVEAGQGRLAPAALARLQALLDSPAFRDLGRRYLPANTCCDRFEYTVRVERAEGEQTVTTIDGVKWPAPLADAIGLLQEARRQVDVKGRHEEGGPGGPGGAP